MLLIGNGSMITRDPAQPFLADGCVAIDGDTIIAVGKTDELKAKYPAARFSDAKGRIIMPGLINSHMHLYSTFARGMALKDASPENFVQILERLWWRLDKVLTTEDVYYSALPVMIDCIKNGTTTIFDHHASPGAVKNSLFTLAKAGKEIGLRGCYAYEVSDRDGQAVMEAGIRENMDFINHANNGNDPLLRGMFGLHASMTLSDDTLKRCAAAKKGSDAGFHVHTAEALSDQEHSLATHGKRVVERFHEFGILGEKSIAVHCVHVNDAERRLLKESKTAVVHNPESNMGNAVGCSPVLSMVAQGILMGLGTDGYTSDMLESYKVANILHKHQQADPGAAWGEIPTMLFANNAAIAAKYFPKPLGQLKPGAYGDVIVVDYQPPTALSADNANGHILFGMSGRGVVTTVVGGELRMEERQLVGIDEAAVCAEARKLSAKVWERF